IRVNKTESRFAASLNRLLQQNRHLCDMPTAPRDVRVCGYSGRHLLVLSSSQFDLLQKIAARESLPRFWSVPSVQNEYRDQSRAPNERPIKFVSSNSPILTARSKPSRMRSTRRSVTLGRA